MSANLDELIAISAMARDIEDMSDEQLERMWLHMQDDDADVRRIFKSAAVAVRQKRLAMARPANVMAA
jgi:hypothetical protein